MSLSLRIASRLQRKHDEVTMAAVKQQVLNWLYSVLTSVRPAIDITKCVLSSTRNTKM